MSCDSSFVSRTLRTQALRRLTGSVRFSDTAVRETELRIAPCSLPNPPSFSHG